MSGGFSETNLKKLYNLLDIDGSGFVGKDEFTVSLPLQIPAKRSLGPDPFGWCRLAALPQQPLQPLHPS